MSAPTEGKGTKLVFVGDPGVGKTCIISRFIKGSFEADVASTMGANYISKTIEVPELGESLDLDIWDTAGQEKYKSLTRIFFKGAKLAVLVYDITRNDTFENMKNVWLKEIKEHADEDIIIGIAGNKSDLYDEEKVPEEEARAFAKSIGAVFSLTSAQNNSGINELFKNLVKKYLDPNASDSDNSQNNVKKPEPNPEILDKKPEQKQDQKSDQKPNKKQGQNQQQNNIKLGQGDVNKKKNKKSC
jgi:small GTP-binding protein